MLHVSIIDIGLPTTKRTGRHAFWRKLLFLYCFIKTFQLQTSEACFTFKNTKSKDWLKKEQLGCRTFRDIGGNKQHTLGTANGEYVKTWKVGCGIRTSGMRRCVAGLMVADASILKGQEWFNVISLLPPPPHNKLANKK
jgi:hypothetical protein